MSQNFWSFLIYLLGGTQYPFGPTKIPQKIVPPPTNRVNPLSGGYDNIMMGSQFTWLETRYFKPF